MQGMKIDFITSTIIITKAFREAASDSNTEEYIALSKVQKENPQMRIVLRNTKATRGKSGYKGLTYKYMRKFITVMDSDNLINFENTKLHYESYDYTNGTVYQYMKEWFLNNYPDHKEMIAAAAPTRAA